MTSIINNSNANSALVNSLNDSESKMLPDVYSTKKIYPAAASCYVRTDLSSGTVGASKTITFNLMKYGIAQQILLSYTKNFSTTGKVRQNDLYNIIERVELLSSSKVISTLTHDDLMAQFSDLDTAQYAPIADSALDARTTNATAHTFVVPLVFGFMKDINTNLNLQFNEQMSIRVKFGSNLTEAGSAGVVDTTTPISDVFLKMRYKAYNEKDFAQIVSENYNRPELNQMVTAFYDESSATDKYAANAAAATRKLKVELKNTDCVNDFYVYVRRISGKAAYTSDDFQPIALNKVTFSASGQEIYNLELQEQTYGRLCENGFSVATASNSITGLANSWLKNTVKIQSGLWEYSGGGAQSNTISLRELNNPVIEVEFNTDTIGTSDETYEMVVVEDCVKIFSTTSSNGRLNLALSN
jgi:hypothetical protein